MTWPTGCHPCNRLHMESGPQRRCWSPTSKMSNLSAKRLDDSREYTRGYAGPVKTAVSLPDDLFRLAEAAARRLRVSRSELYAKAIAEYLNRQQDNAITERLNEVYSNHQAKLDPGLDRAQLESVERDTW